MILGFDLWVLGSAKSLSFFHKIWLMFAACFLLRKDWGTKDVFFFSWAFSVFLSFQDDAVPLNLLRASCVPTCNPLH